VSKCPHSAIHFGNQGPSQASTAGKHLRFVWPPATLKPTAGTDRKGIDSSFYRPVTGIFDPAGHNCKKSFKNTVFRPIILCGSSVSASMGQDNCNQRLVGCNMKKRVLYVDDEPSNLKALRRLFRDQSFEFVTYDSPAEALSKIDLVKPTVVISDQRMPEMEGTLFLEKVKYRHPDCACIILTGHADLETAMQAINKGHVFGFVQKPWDDDALIAQVQAALEHQESAICVRTIIDTLVEEVIDNERTQKSMHKLASAVCCELNRPLVIMTGYCQLLRNAFKDEEIPQRYLANMLLQIERMEELSKKIATIARKAGNGRYNLDDPAPIAATASGRGPEAAPASQP
jgi:FixJ family two-component response regulator